MTAIATSLPATPFSAALSSVSCAAVSACAEVTSAETSPRCFGGDAAERLDHAGNGEQAAVTRHDPQEIGDEAADAGLLAERAIAFN